MKSGVKPKIVLSLLGLSGLALPSPGRAQTPPAGEKHGVDADLLDRTVKPDVNFYEFANGGWLKQTTIPADKPAIDGFTEVALRNEAILKGIVEKLAADPALPTDSEAKKISDFYRVGMDEALAERLGVAPLTPIFDKIEGVTDRESLLREIASLHRMGVGAGFEMAVEADFKDSRRKILILAQGGLALPDRDYYLKDDPQSKMLRERYVAYASKTLELAGEKPEDAAKDAADILALETRLAKASRTRVQMRDVNGLYHLMDLKALQALAPGLDWAAYFKETGLENPGQINVATPEFFQALDKTTAEIPLAQWKTYLRWQTLAAYTPYLSKPFADERFRFVAMLTGQKEQPPRWRRVLGTTEGVLGDAVGKLYVAQAFPPEAKQKALALVLNLKSALRGRIQKLDWMGAQTKAEAFRKLDTMIIKIGYPDKWKDYSGLKVGADSYVQNMIQASEFAFDRELKKAGKPVDRTDWGMTPQTVNAYYNPLNNEIVFPAGILQPPFFDAKADDASNYGAIGAVIGHEMTHGFDDQGRQFDSKGNLRDWWTAEDAKRFAERSAALVKQYGGYKAIDAVKVNGELTQGENIADLGGITVAFQAWKKTPQAKKREKIDGFTPEQRFFLAFGQIWRFKSSPEYTKLLANLDTHSPSPWRVRGTLVNVPDFIKAFGSGDPASDARPGSGAVRIW